MYLSLYLLALPLPLFGYEAAVITGFWLACLQLHSVKCHKVPFSICLFHATLHQPLTCGVHVVLEGGRFIQSKTSWKLALVFPFSSKDCVEGNFMTRRWIFISVFLGIWRSVFFFNLYFWNKIFFHCRFFIFPVNSIWSHLCNIHIWSTDCFSSGNYLKRESSCAFLMDCACLPLFYMDRELVWRSVILFRQSPLLILEGRISPVFSLYFSCASRTSRLDDPGSWWKWISFSFPLETVGKKVNLFVSVFLCEIFPPPNLLSVFFFTQTAF